MQQLNFHWQADGYFGRREDLMMSWAERLGNGSSKRVC